jgi:NAD(P)-dependent dehydrogenase (short-subunit alcohol dehydrogenase family)
VVTGASGGIGRAIAGMLAGRGWRLTLIARDGRRLERLAAGLSGDGHRVAALDVADEGAWAAIAGALADVEGLVCAAARLEPIGPLGRYAIPDFRRTLDVNVTGTLLAVQSCLPALRERGGRIVTFSGGGATGPLPRFDAYAASKAAIVRLTENLALELAGDGVRINCVAPGFVATDMHNKTLEAGRELVGDDYYERTARELQAGGVPATETAELVCVLLESDAIASGRLISAQWDPWRAADFWRRLAEDPDLGTLRRIDEMLFSAAREASAPPG